jgi:hypothetical protein
MYLFKASGATYRRVCRQSKHAFPVKPKGVPRDRFVLLSKNREDCAMAERQIQHVAKVLEFRDPLPGELDASFPGVGADQKWKYIVDLYWGRALTAPFNLSEIPGLNYKRYDTVQDFAELDEPDAELVAEHLARTDPDLLLDFVNHAERP